MRTDEDRVQPLTLKLKRSASGIQRLTTSSLTPPLHIKPSSTSVFPTTSAIKSTSSATLNNCSPSSVQAARKNVQSTAELVAQISEQLQHYGTIFETSTLVSNGNKDTIKQQLQVHLENEVIPMPALAENGVEFVTKYDSTSTKKRRVKLSDPNQNHSQDIELINGRHQTEDAVQNKKESKKKRGRPKVTDTGIYLNNITDGSVMNEKTATTTNNSQSLTSTPKFNWFEKYPLPNVPTKKPDSSQILSTIIDHPCNSYTLPLNTYNDEKTTEETEKKKILILPYLDIGEPDWLIHGFPERERYLFPDFDSISSFQSLKQKWK